MQPSHTPPSASANAVKNNKKLFSVFAKKLSQTDEKAFSDYADRFAAWLSDSRAYYQEARPEILRVLTIAYWTVRRNAAPGLDPNAPFHIASYFDHPLMGPYNRLLQQVYQHKDRFTEPELASKLRGLLQTVLRSSLPSSSTPTIIDLTEESPEIPPQIPSQLSQPNNRQPLQSQNVTNPSSVNTGHPSALTEKESLNRQRYLDNRPSIFVNTNLAPFQGSQPNNRSLPQPQNATNPSPASISHPRTLPKVEYSPISLTQPINQVSYLPGLVQSVPTSIQRPPSAHFPLVPANFNTPPPAPLPPIGRQIAASARPAKIPPAAAQAPRPIPVQRSATAPTAPPSGHNDRVTADMPLSAHPDLALSSPFSMNVLTHGPINTPPPPKSLQQTHQVAAEGALLRQNSAPASFVLGLAEGSQLPTPTPAQPHQTPPAILTKIQTQFHVPTMVASPVSMIPTETLPTLSRPSSSAGGGPIPPVAVKTSAPPTPVIPKQNTVLASSPSTAVPPVRASTTPNPQAIRSASISVVSPPPSSTPGSTASATTASNAVRKAKRKPRVQLDQLIAKDIKAYTGVKAEPVDDSYLLQKQAPFSPRLAGFAVPPPPPFANPWAMGITSAAKKDEVIVISDDEDMTVPLGKIPHIPPSVDQQKASVATEDTKVTPMKKAEKTLPEPSMAENNAEDSDGPVQVQEPSFDSAPRRTEDVEMRDDTAPHEPVASITDNTDAERQAMDVEPPMASLRPDPVREKQITNDDGDVEMDEGDKNVIPQELPQPESTPAQEPAIEAETSLSRSDGQTKDLMAVDEIMDHAIKDTDDADQLGTPAPTQPPVVTKETGTAIRSADTPELGSQLPNQMEALEISGENTTSVQTDSGTDSVNSASSVSPVKPRRPDAFEERSQCAAQVAGQQKKCTIRLTISVDITKYEAVVAWRDRKTHSKPLENTYCYTLWCYPANDQRIEDPTPSLDINPPSIWPSNGYLDMVAVLRGKKVTLPMAPPLRVGPYGMIDVTDYVSSRDCKIELVQTDDMTNYHFVLRMHHPLQCQLEEAYRRREKDEKWKKWVADFTKPFDIPLPSTIAAA